MSGPSELIWVRACFTHYLLINFKQVNYTMSVLAFKTNKDIRDILHLYVALFIFNQYISRFENNFGRQSFVVFGSKNTYKNKKIYTKICFAWPSQSANSKSGLVINRTQLSGSAVKLVVQLVTKQHKYPLPCAISLKKWMPKLSLTRVPYHKAPFWIQFFSNFC